jgi:Asp-tRNA(Asn)/Glu-tRNA(Gln) amidotransferase A subunit family amidase
MTGQLNRIVAAHRAGQVSPLETVRHAITRIESADPQLRFLAAERFERALREAADCTDLSGPLAGVPVLIKDLEDVTGMPTRKGSRLLDDVPAAAADSTVPARLQAAGAIVVGKATLPEFAIQGFTANLVDGITRNPWNSELSPGGSSGGSAAALASGCVPVATATDGGGSIRIPAAYCGLVGLKPTNGVVGRWPAPDWIDYSTEGPFATTAEDLRLLLNVIAGPVAGDPAALPLDVLPVAGQHRFTRIVAMTRTSDLGDVPAEMTDLLENAVSHLAELLGAQVTWLAPGTLFQGGDPDLDWFTVAPVEHLDALGRVQVEQNLHLMHPSSQEFFTAGLAISLDDYLAARRRRFGYAKTLMDLLGDDGVLVTCTNGLPGVPADGRMGSDVLLPPAAFNTAVFNITGNPALSLPFGTLRNGLPFGFQVVAPHFRDQDLVQLASVWQRQFPWPLVADGYSEFSSYLD